MPAHWHIIFAGDVLLLECRPLAGADYRDMYKQSFVDTQFLLAFIRDNVHVVGIYHTEAEIPGKFSRYVNFDVI